MKAPCCYADWSVCLETLASGSNDEAVILAMTQGELSWTSGVATLFSERISEAFSSRLQHCAKRLSRNLSLGADETTLVRALMETRRSLALLHRVALIPVFPSMLREHLCSELKQYAERTHNSLEDSARHDRSGKLASLIRHNSLLNYDTPAACAPPPSPPSTAHPQPGTPVPTRKRTILA